MAKKKKKQQKATETPLMKQYNQIKGKYPDAMLLFRVGDFYETFGEDAVKASKILGIILTKRKNGAASHIELSGFPHHSLETYLPKLVRAGERVAICDQLEDPKATKKIVKRGVTELVTPGVAYSDKVLEYKKNNFLAAVHMDNKTTGLALLDISTGEFYAAEGSEEYINKLLQSFEPKEVLFQKQKSNAFKAVFGDQFYTYKLEDWVYTLDFAEDTLLNHFETKSLKGFGIDQMKTGIVAAGVALYYLSDTQHDSVGHISSISRIEEDQYVWLDRFTIRNLELFYSPNEDATTLLEVLDQTITAMGGRMLKRWLALPLKDMKEIKNRQGVVELFLKEPALSEELEFKLNEMGDLERLISKVSTGRIAPRELKQLHHSMRNVEPIKKLCLDRKNKYLKKVGDQFNPCDIITQKIGDTIVDEPPVALNKGEVIRNGVDEELDNLRKVLYSGKDHLDQILEKESKRTGIPNLKIAFNNVFGYYLEVRNTHKTKVPDDWVRKQTLTQAERYITEELKEYEGKILGAEEKIEDLQTRLYQQLVREVMEYVVPIQHNANLIARLDCLLSFSKSAKLDKYKKPNVNDTNVIDIKGGRHPVIEKELPLGEAYVENDLYLDPEEQQILMITGPNMSGKSALLRQTALITLMAQMGAFVPANKASIGVVDKIFTRVGASDNISSGESTFMVEMNETASILNNVTDRSLVLLDEIGRGTSTYDGISIAWAIAEYLHEKPGSRAKTLFATHYHELNEMSSTFGRIKNFNVSVKELKNKVIFMRKLVPGGSEHSFGIHVAKMAGMPKEVIQRANQVLKQLENSHSSEHLNEGVKKVVDQKKEDMQLSFFQLDDPVLSQIKEEIANLDVDTLTPVEALMKLNEIKKLTGE